MRSRVGRAVVGWVVRSWTTAAASAAMTRSRHRRSDAASVEWSSDRRATRFASVPVWAVSRGCERTLAPQGPRSARGSWRTRPDPRARRWLRLARWAQAARSHSASRVPSRVPMPVWVPARARAWARFRSRSRASRCGRPWNPWALRVVLGVEGRRRPLADGCGRPGRPRWTRTGSRHRFLISERARATPCSSSRVPSRARVPGSSSAPKRSLTSECVRRAHTQSHILSQPSAVRTSPRTNERDQAVHVGGRHRRP